MNAKINALIHNSMTSLIKYAENVIPLVKLVLVLLQKTVFLATIIPQFYSIILASFVPEIPTEKIVSAKKDISSLFLPHFALNVHLNVKIAKIKLKNVMNVKDQID
jgi:hypothetical protein